MHHDQEKGPTVKSTERSAHPNSAPKAGLLALLSGLLHVRGSGAPSPSAPRAFLLALVAFLPALAVSLVLSVTSAEAAVIHEYLPGPSEAITEGVPAGSLAAGGEPAETGPVGGDAYYSMAASPGETPGGAGHLWIDEQYYSHHRVDEFNASSGAWELQLEHIGGLSFPGSLAVGASTGEGSTGEREVYVTSAAGVAVFGPSGKLQTMWTVSGAEGLAIDSSTSFSDEYKGDVYVSTSAGIVEVFKPEKEGGEKHLTQIPGRCPNPDTVVGATGCEGAQIIPFSHKGSGVNSDVAVDLATGDVLVTDENAVDVFEPMALGQYKFARQITGIPGRSFGKPIDAVRAGGGEEDGDFYIMESQSQGSVIVVYQLNSEGVYLGSLTETSTGPFANLRSIAVDPASGIGDPAAGDVFVGDAYDEGQDLGAVDVFGSNIVIPDVVTGAPSEVTPFSAVLNGTVNPLKQGPAKCQFVWGVSEAFGQSAECEPKEVPEGDTPANVHSEEVTGLQPDRTYYYRLRATNKNGTNTGVGSVAECEGKPAPAACFTTPGPGIREESVSDVASTSATFGGLIDPHGDPTIYYVEYGPTTAYGSDVPSLPGEAIGSGTEVVTLNPHHIDGLSPSTVYHYRVVAISEIELEGGKHEVKEFAGPDRTFKTQGPGGFALPDGRTWEIVSPPQKEGALLLAAGNNGSVDMAAAGGGAITYVAYTPTELGDSGYTNDAQMLSVRGPDGWTTRDLNIPHDLPSGASAQGGQEYRLFSEDLSVGIVQPLGPFSPCHSSAGVAQPCLSPEAAGQTAFSRDLETGVYTPLVTGCPASPAPCEPAVEENADVPPGTLFEKEEGYGGFHGPYFHGMTPDGSHVVVLTPGAVGWGLYEWSAGKPAGERLAPVSVLPAKYGGELVQTEYLGARVSGVGDADARGAISDDGSRVFWTAGVLFMRANVGRPPSPVEGERCTVLTDACTVQIGGDNEPQFQLATSDGTRVFYTESNNLYECEVQEALECDPTVLGQSGTVIGASEDGSYVYSVDPGNNQLYMYHDVGGVWRQTPIATLSKEDDVFDSPGELGQLRARVSPDGRWLAFMSDQELTGHDNEDVFEGETGILDSETEDHLEKRRGPYADEEVFLYDAQTGRLTCASCNPTGARPVGFYEQDTTADAPVQIPGDYGFLAAVLPQWVYSVKDEARYQPRYLSNEGRLFFDSYDGLVPQDVNGGWDVYEYEPEGAPAGSGYACSAAGASGSDVFEPAHVFEAEGVKGEEGAGCVSLISSGRSAQESAFLDASETGGDVFFLTTSKLAPQQFGHEYNVYDAHECASSSPCIPSPSASPPECTTPEACRAAPQPEPAIYGAPSSVTFSGLGNLTPEAPPTPRKVSRKPVRCKKDFVKNKSGKCVKKSKERSKRAKKTSDDRRAR